MIQCEDIVHKRDCVSFRGRVNNGSASFASTCCGDILLVKICDYCYQAQRPHLLKPFNSSLRLSCSVGEG